MITISHADTALTRIGDRLQALGERIGTDLGGAMVSALAYVGDKLGLSLPSFS